MSKMQNLSLPICQSEVSKEIKRKKVIKRNLFVYSFLLIPLINLAIFYFYINIDSIMLAFDVPDGENIFYYFNYFLKQLSSNESIINQAFVNTFRFFFLNTFILLPIGYVLAYFLYKKISGYKFFRIMFFLPSLISATVVVSLFKRIIAVNGPLIDVWVKLTGSTFYPELLGNSDYAIWTILAYVFWVGFGSNFLLLEGTMKRIPDEVLEYARLDGVTPFRELVSIITPIIFPTLSTLILLAFTAVFTVSGPILLFTEGEFSTFTISYYIFDLTYKGGAAQYPLASAIGLFFTVIGIPIVFLVRWITGKLDNKVDY